MNKAEENTSEPVSAVSKSTLLVVFLTVFIDLLGFGIVLPLLPRYGTWFHASSGQLSLLMASFSVMQFLFAPMWGVLSDRFGRRPILLLGLLGSSCSYTLFGYISSRGEGFDLLGIGALGWLFVSRIGAGIAGATISTAQAVIADCTGVKNRGRGMALIGAAFGIGFTFGPLIGAVCVSDDNPVALTVKHLRIVNAWESDTTLVTADDFLAEIQTAGPLDEVSVTAARQVLAQPMSKAKLSGLLTTPPSGLPGYVGGALSAAALLLAAFRLQESRRPGVTGGTHRGFRLATVARHLTSPRLSVILAAVFVTTFGFAQFESTLSLLTQRFGYSSRWNYLLYAYVGFVLSLGQGLLVRRLLPKVGETRMALAGVFLMTLGFILIGITGMKILPGSALWFILPIVVIGFSAVTPSLQSLLSLAADSHEQGAVLGTGQSLSSLARIFGPALGIALLDKSTSMPYFLGACLILCGGVLVSRIRTLPRTGEQAEAGAPQ